MLQQDLDLNLSIKEQLTQRDDLPFTLRLPTVAPVGRNHQLVVLLKVVNATALNRGY